MFVDVCLNLFIYQYLLCINICQTLVVARTDAEASTLLDNNVDPRDHPFIIGATNPKLTSLNQV